MQKALFLIIFPVLAMTLLLISTQRYGLGITTDSIAYIEVARNIQNGEGIVDREGELVTHWPPLYPLVLAGMAKVTGLEVVKSGRYPHLLLLGSFMLLFNLALFRWEPEWWTVLLINLVLLVSLPLGVFFMFWSEGLFLMLLMGLVLVLLLWAEKQRIYLLLVAGLLAGGLLLSRYAGAGMLVGAFLFILLFPNSSFKSRIPGLLTFGATALLVFAIWFFYAQTHTGDPVDRELTFHLVTWAHIVDLASTLHRWTLPHYPVQSVILIILFLVWVIPLKKDPADPSGFFKQKWAIFRQKIHRLSLEIKIVWKDSQAHLRLLGILGGTYMLFLLISISFCDAHTPLDNRILAPVFPILLLLLTPFLKQLMNFPRLRRGLLLCGAVVVFTTSLAAWGKYHFIFSNGEGFNGKHWVESPTLAAVATLEGKDLYTNGHEVIWLYFPDFEGQVLKLPRKLEAGTSKVNENFEQEWKELRDQVLSEERQLCYFDKVVWRYYYPDREFILEELGNGAVVNFGDGFVIK